MAKHVYDKAAGRVKVVGTGTFEGTVEEQAAFCKRMDEVTDAVVVLICLMAKEDESDAVWKANVQKLLDLTGDIPLGLCVRNTRGALAMFCRLTRGVLGLSSRSSTHE